MQSIDMEHTGSINFTQFIAATMDKSLYLKEEKLLECFKLFDTNGSGIIKAESLKEILKKNPMLAKDSMIYNQMITELEIFNSGGIDYHDFLDMMA